MSNPKISVSDTVLKVFQQLPDGYVVSGSALGRLLGVNCGPALYNLQSAPYGFIDKVKRGKYRLTSRGRAYDGPVIRERSTEMIDRAKARDRLTTEDRVTT